WQYALYRQPFTSSQQHVLSIKRLLLMCFLICMHDYILYNLNLIIASFFFKKSYFKQRKTRYRLSYLVLIFLYYFSISVTTPEPTVLPPSRIEKRVPFSIAIGEINSITISMLSPGITIST